MPTGRQSTETHWEVDREVYWAVDQSSPTDKPKAHRDAVYRDTNAQVDQDSTEAANRERNQKSTDKSTKRSTKILLKPPIKSNNEVDRMVTKADMQRRLPRHAASTSQCHFPRTTGCKIYSTEHAEALHRAQRAQMHLNLVSITIVEKLTY